MFSAGGVAKAGLEHIRALLASEMDASDGTRFRDHDSARTGATHIPVKPRRDNAALLSYSQPRTEMRSPPLADFV